AEVLDLSDMSVRGSPKENTVANAPQGRAEARAMGADDIEDEIQRLKAAPADATPFAERFMTAPSPGIVATTMQNAYYASHEAYLMALARELRPEYLAIHRAGLILQIDAPDLAMERTMTFQDVSDSEFVSICELHMAAINAA